MNAKAIVLVGFLCATLGLASQDGPPVAKVKSYSCDRPSDIYRRGSGILISHNSRRFLLTSSHALFHGDRKDGICHELIAEGKLIAVDHLVAVDATKEMALLEIREPGTQGLPMITFSKLVNAVLPPRGTQVTLAGVAFGSETFESSVGHVSNPIEDRAVIARIPQVIGIEGRSEKGNSGGGVFDTEGNLVGMISHQYLHAALGKTASLQNYDDAETKESIIVLVIPTREIVSWVTSVVDQVGVVDYREVLSTQIEGSHREIAFGGLCFNQTRQIFGDGVGIGGGEDVPISVGDATIELSLDLANQQKWPFRKTAWVDRALAKLQSRNTLVITGLQFKGKRYPVPELMKLFHLVEKGYEPLIRVTHSSIEDLDQVTEKLVGLGAKATELIARAQEATKDSVSTQLLLQDLSLVCEAIENQQFELIYDDTLQNLVKPGEGSHLERGWETLFNRFFAEARELKSIFYTLRDLLPKVRV